MRTGTRRLRYWRSLPSDDDATFDREVPLDAQRDRPDGDVGHEPSGRAADHGARAGSVGRRRPAPANGGERRSPIWISRPARRSPTLRIDRVFIGSCTNSRIEDLRVAAKVAMDARAVVPALVSPGSGLVKQQAEAEGLDRIFTEAGFEWVDAGCSMCVGMNGDLVPAGVRCASTSNRNFEGRQGKGARTHLMSPAMVAAAAVTGRLSDVRQPGELVMEPFVSSTAVAAPMDMPNVDTDQIIPARFLWRPRATATPISCSTISASAKERRNALRA